MEPKLDVYKNLAKWLWEQTKFLGESAAVTGLIGKEVISPTPVDLSSYRPEVQEIIRQKMQYNKDQAWKDFQSNEMNFWPFNRITKHLLDRSSPEKR